MGRWVVVGVILVGLGCGAADGEWDVDLRNRFSGIGLFPGTQGRRGTCSVFAIAGLCEYEWSVAEDRSTPLSAEYLNWARHRAVPASSDGGFFHDIVQGLRLYGICRRELMPYVGAYVPELVPGDEALRDGVGRRGFCAHWLKVHGTPVGLAAAEHEAVLAALRDGHPVALGLQWVKGENCIGDDGLVDLGRVEGPGSGHSVIAVGFRMSTDLAGGGAYIVRNHSGSDWGAEGYAMLPFAWTSAQVNDAVYLEVMARGALTVRSLPSGARVEVNGEERGRTPLSVSALCAGVHGVRVGVPVGWCVDREVDVRPGEATVLEVEPVAAAPPVGRRAGQEWVHEPSGVALVFVPLGDRRACRALQAPVPPGPFWIGRTEVSNGQFGRFAAATGYAPVGAWALRAGEEALPAADVTYDDAAAFCAWVGGRLPTEGEWEWAARGPALPAFPWGPVADLGRYVGGGTPMGGEARPVDSLAEGASWCGALHMVGNVSEWCRGPLPENVVDRCVPFAWASDSERAVLRGGSYVHGPEACRPTWRYVGWRDRSGRLDGFRVVMPALRGE